jgi:small subunit ribosomal protein S21
MESFSALYTRGVMRMAEVRLQEGESLENALHRFKRKVQTKDIIKDVKRPPMPIIRSQKLTFPMH